MAYEKWDTRQLKRQRNWLKLRYGAESDPVARGGIKAQIYRVERELERRPDRKESA